MYLSKLIVDLGDNPDRPRPGRLWLRNIYHVHQRLCMAFPSAARKADDPDFLKPYEPKDFLPGEVQQPQHVHNKRQTDSGFLFRIDPLDGGRAMILVQSAIQPDWEYSFHNAKHFLAAPCQAKPFDPTFANGQNLGFRLVANPTRKIDTKSGPDGKNRNGRRVPVQADKLAEWLQRHGMKAGFSVEKHSCHHGYVYFNKQKGKDGNRLFSVHFDGILKVVDSAVFLQLAITRGIGSAKALGFGLLSVMPLSPAQSEEK
ncbi:MAG: type I-E CRISPR-associated protein Cas6/Cse3/CasE [Nitrospinae bacterium]|nr:type I-E CRISPR-associated protein Cas6/Cse3/CasE [Nitrospinota bacterium]